MDTLKRDHLSKPVSCVHLTQCVWYGQNSFAFHGRHLAILRVYPRRVRRHDDWIVVLHIYDVDGEGDTDTEDDVRRCSVQCSEKPRGISMGDRIVFIAGDNLYLFTFDGRRRVRPLPGKYGHGAINTHGNKVAILQNGQNSDRESVLESDTLWVYDYQLDEWTVKSMPEVSIVSCWYQALIIEDTVHVVSVGQDVSPSENTPSPDGWAYIMHVQSGESSWTHQYTIAQTRYQFNMPGNGCTPHCSGSDYDLDVVTREGRHTVRMTLDRVVSVDIAVMARWNETVFKSVEGGIETRAGFLWNDSMPSGHQRPTLLLANADYLVVLFDGVYADVKDIYVCRFRGRRRELLPCFIWEDAGENRAAQIARRAELVLGNAAAEAAHS